MRATRGKATGRRVRLVQELRDAVRAHSTAAVLFHTAVAERFGLGPTDIKAVELLHRLGPLTAGELVERTGLASSSVTALIDRLVDHGLTRRVRDSGDRRRVVVELVPHAAGEVAAQFGGVTRRADGLWEVYSDQELELILGFLRRATELLSTGTRTRVTEADS